VAYRIEVTAEAEGDLRSLQKRDQQQVRAALPRFLAETPAAESHARKPLDTNPFGAGWELRLGDLRVLYAIDELIQAVWVLRVGRKVRERLYLRGLPVETRLP
jgi:mRNA-degrading endonuclease RelE of RelBE toxin-antitoxin system